MFENQKIYGGLNYLKKRITSNLKLLKDKEIINKATYKNIKPVGSRPGVWYGLGKVHKEAKNGQPPFQPIFSAIGTPTYKLAKYLLPFLTPLTQNEYTVTDSFHFAEEIWKQDTNLYMSSLHVDSLFTFIPLDEKEPLIFALIVCIKMMRIALRSVRMFFVICLPWPPKNRFLCLTTNSINKLMLWLWVFH